MRNEAVVDEIKQIFTSGLDFYGFDLLIYDVEDYQIIQWIFSNNGKNLFGVLESSTNNNPALVVLNLKSI